MKQISKFILERQKGFKTFNRLLFITRNQYTGGRIVKGSMFYTPEHHNKKGKSVNKQVRFQMEIEKNTLEFVAYNKLADLICKILSEWRCFEITAKAPSCNNIFCRNPKSRKKILHEILTLQLGEDLGINMTLRTISNLMYDPDRPTPTLAEICKHFAEKAKQDMAVTYKPGDKTFGYAVVQCVV